MGSDLLVGWGSAVCLQEVSVPVSFFSGCSDFHLQSKYKFFQLTGDSELCEPLVLFVFGLSVSVMFPLLSTASSNKLSPFRTFMVNFIIMTKTFNIYFFII